MLRKIKDRWQVDGIFFLVAVLENSKNAILSKLVSFALKKQVKLVFPCKVRGLQFIHFGNHFSCGSGLWLEAIDQYYGQTFLPQIILSDHVNLSNNVHIACINSICIEKGVLIGSNVFIGDHSHGNLAHFEVDIMPKFRTLHSRGAIVIGENTWIGDGVQILDNVTIGTNCIIGAQSVVNNDIPANSLAVGVPAKVIKRLVDGKWVGVNDVR